MTWVQFINKTKFSAIYIQFDERNIPLLLPRDTISRYIQFPAGSVAITIFDNRGHQQKNQTISIIPAKLQTIILN